MPDNRWTVIKVGGSLYDLPDLKPRLRAWLGAIDGPKLLVPGGGVTADAIRQLDSVHRLGQEASHWLAIQALSVNARFLHTLLPEAPVISSLAYASGSDSFIVDPLPFFGADDSRADHFPHRWDVTSDSLAARAAALLTARELILLKSLDWSDPDWTEAVRTGVVDAFFPEAARPLLGETHIRVVNFRKR